MSVLSDLLNEVMTIDRAADAIEFEGRWFTWAELADTIDAIRSHLRSLDLSRDARIGILVRNRPSPFAAILATMSMEACLVSLNPLFPDERLRADILALKLPVLIGEAEDVGRQGVLDAIGEARPAVIELHGMLEGATLREGFAVPGPGVRREEPGVIIEMLTSGTTGAPKRIPLKRAAFDKSFVSAMSYERGRSADDAARLRPETMILHNPLSHIGGLWHALSCMAAGRRACLLEKFNVPTWHDAVKRHRPKVAGAVPAGLRMILDADIPREDLSSLVAIRTGTAPLDPAIVAEFLDRYGVPVLQTYGATEFSGAVAGWTLKDFHTFHDSKAGSVGRFQPGVSGRVADAETGEEMPAGEEGVLEMKAAQFGIGEAWLRTTDRAVIDADGFLFIRGRADNAIIRGGFKVHPDDVVKALEAHPAVREAVVIGIADRRLGSVPVAAIMIRAGAVSPSEEELTAFARERLLPYQVPTRFRFVDDVPRTPTLKPALPQVREMFSEAEIAAAV